jgi:hypothetical protein
MAALAARVRQQQQQQQHNGHHLELPEEVEVEGRAVRGLVLTAEEGVGGAASWWGDLLLLTVPATLVT